MLPLADADKEEARYQELIEPFKIRARTSASSLVSPTPDFASSVVSSACEVSGAFEQGMCCARHYTDGTSFAEAERLCVVSSPEGPDQSAAEVSWTLREGTVAGTVLDTGGLSPIIETATTPPSETFREGTGLIDPSSTLHNEAPAPPDSAPMSSASGDAYDVHFNKSWEGVQRNINNLRQDSNPTSSTTGSRPSSPILSGTEVYTPYSQRGQRARRTRTAKGRSSSDSRSSSIPSRQNSGETGENLDSREPSVQHHMKTSLTCETSRVGPLLSVDVPEGYAVDASRPHPSAKEQRGRGTARNLLAAAPATLPSFPGSLTPPRNSSPASHITTRAHLQSAIQVGPALPEMTASRVASVE